MIEKRRIRRGSKHGIDWREYRLRASDFSKHGTALPQSKLTDDLVRQLRDTRYVITSSEWAMRLGMSKSAIEKARMGWSWRHVK